MPGQPTDYRQYLVPDTDAGPNQWNATGVPHWAEIDEAWTAPDTADRINALGAAIAGKAERFGFTLPNHENLEGGFDQIIAGLYCWHTAGLGVNDIDLDLNLYVKGAWQGVQTVTVIVASEPNAIWYYATWSVYNCDVNDADNILLNIKIGPNPGGAPYGGADGIYVSTVYLRITGQAILTTAQAKNSSFF